MKNLFHAVISGRISGKFQFLPNSRFTLRMAKGENITELLFAWSDGDESSLERLIPLVEAELHRMAHNYMRRENPNHTLQTTALVHEAYLKLVDQTRVKWQNRAHFFAIASQTMRRILLNYARDRKAGKRGGNAEHIPLDEFETITREKSDEIIALDEALERLAKFDKTKSRIVEMRYFGGLTIDETAEVLHLAPVTVMRHWRMAKAWLQRELTLTLPT